MANEKERKEKKEKISQRFWVGCCPWVSGEIGHGFILDGAVLCHVFGQRESWLGATANHTKASGVQAVS